MFAPEFVTPAVVFLASEDAPTGVIVTAGAGTFSKAEIIESQGVYLGEGGVDADEVAANWGKISDMTGAKPYFQGGEQTGKFIERMSGK